MKKYFKETWSDAENDLLLEYYYVLSREVLLAVLPGRKLPDIIMQVGVLTKANRKFER